MVIVLHSGNQMPARSCDVCCRKQASRFGILIQDRGRQQPMILDDTVNSIRSVIISPPDNSQDLVVALLDLTGLPIARGFADFLVKHSVGLKRRTPVVTSCNFFEPCLGLEDRVRGFGRQSFCRTTRLPAPGGHRTDRS